MRGSCLQLACQKEVGLGGVEEQLNIQYVSKVVSALRPDLLSVFVCMYAMPLALNQKKGKNKGKNKGKKKGKRRLHPQLRKKSQRSLHPQLRKHNRSSKKRKR